MGQLALGNLNHADKVWHLRQAELASELADLDLFAITEMCDDRVYPKGQEILRSEDSVTNSCPNFRVRFAGRCWGFPCLPCGERPCRWFRCRRRMTSCLW